MMAMMILPLADASLHADAPAKTAPPPQISADLLNHAAQGEVRVLVRVSETTTSGISASAMRMINAVALDFAHRSPHSYSHIPFLAMAVDASDLARLRADPRIASIEEDRPHELTLTDTTTLIGAVHAWAGGYAGAGQSIAILDTGFDAAHPMLQGKVVAEACFSQAGANSLCPNGAGQQIGAGAAIHCDPLSGGSMGRACMHGTHVAGIALGSSAVLSGVAPAATLVGFQIFTKLTSGCSGATPCLAAWDSDILKALDQAYTWRTQYHIAAVNMSLGGGAYTSQPACDSSRAAYKAIISLFNQAGIPVVIASGNNGYANAISDPACLTGAISAGATTKLDTMAYYTNSADFLTLLAPGDSIYSAVPGGFAAMSGTSMAAPHISGAIAVLKSKLPDASVMQLIDTLESTGVSVIDERSGANLREKKRIALAPALDALDPNWKSDAFEPDDTPAQAHAWALNLPQTHRFGAPSDRDWLVLQAQAGQAYRFETLNLSAATDTVINLYAGQQTANPVASNDDIVAGVDLRSVLTYTATADGALYLQVRDWDNSAFLGTRYDVQVTQVDVPVPTPATPSPPPIGTTEPSPTPPAGLKIKVFLPLVSQDFHAPVALTLVMPSSPAESRAAADSH